MIKCILTTTRGVHICVYMIVLYTQNFLNGYGINMLQMRSFYTTFCRQKYDLRVMVCSTSITVTTRHRIILVLPANMGIMCTSAFGLASLGTLSRAAICYLTGWFYWNRSTGTAWKCASSCEAEAVVSTRRSSSTLWVRCLALGEFDTSSKVHRTRRAYYVAYSVIGSNSEKFLSCWDTWRSRFMRSLQEPQKILWQDFKQLKQLSKPIRWGMSQRMSCGTWPFALAWVEATSKA